MSNRDLKGLNEPATSFYRIPRKDGLRTHLPDPQDPRFLLFSLRDVLTELDKASK